MQIVINISKDRYDEIMSMDWKNCRLIFDEEIRAIHDGKALEQEPCDDCVSRQVVLEAIDDDNRNEHYSCFATNNDAECFKQIIRELPSVSLQPKMGYWFIDERPESDREVVCSNCDKPIFKYHKLDFDYRPKYCPNCGAKMSEIPTGAEGSDKE